MKRTSGAQQETTDGLDYLEWMKAEMVESVAGLFKALVKRDQEEVTDAGASVLILAYLLSNRAGVSFQAMESGAKRKLRNSLAEIQGNEYNNLMELLKYLEQQKR